MDQIYSLSRYVWGSWNNNNNAKTNPINIVAPHPTNPQVPVVERRNSNSKETTNLPMCMSCRTALSPETEPKYLDCQHVFCNNCLVEIEYSGVVTCTECKQPTILGSSGIDGLPHYFLKKIESKKNLFQKKDDAIRLKTSEDDEDADSEDASEEEIEPKNNDLVQSELFIDVPLNNPKRKKKKKSLPAQIQPVEPLSKLRLDSDEDEPIPIRLHLSNNDEGSGREDDFIVLDTKPSTPVEKIVPQRYIPFTQKREICKTLVHKWLDERWFVPADLDEKLDIIEPRPVYVPFYCFEVTTTTVVTADIGITNSDGSVEWQCISDRFHTQYKELMACATHSANTTLLLSLLKHPGSFSLLSNQVLPPNAPEYKVTLPIKEEKFEVDIPINEAFKNIETKHIETSEISLANDRIRKTHKTDKVKNFVFSTQVEKSDCFVILLPVYFGTFSYGGVHYEYVISGNKGVVEGNRPMGTGWLGKQMLGAVQTMTNLVNDQFGLKMENLKQ